MPQCCHSTCWNFTVKVTNKILKHYCVSRCLKVYFTKYVLACSQILQFLKDVNVLVKTRILAALDWKLIGLPLNTSSSQSENDN